LVYLRPIIEKFFRNLFSEILTSYGLVNRVILFLLTSYEILAALLYKRAGRGSAGPSAIRVAVLYWAGDDKFPAESKILYDKTIAEQSASDIIHAFPAGIYYHIAFASNGTREILQKIGISTVRCWPPHNDKP
jgi:hypothetical protein